MTAVLLYTGPGLSSLAPFLVLLTIVPIGLLFAPQPLRRDKRIRVLALVLLLLTISAPAWAFPTKICDWCPYCFECWFL